MKKKISFALPDLIERIGTKYNNGVFKCKIVFLPPGPGDKNFQEARNKGGRIRDRRSIVRNLLLPSPPAIIIPRRHPRVEAESLSLPLLSRREKSNRRREERDRKRGGNENRKERRDADLEAFTTTRAFPIVILSPCLCLTLFLVTWPQWRSRGRTSDFIGRSTMTFVDTLLLVARLFRGGRRRRNRRLFGTLGETKCFFFWIEL